MNQASVLEWRKRFKEGSESVRDDVGGVRKSIHQSWLANWLGLGLLYWGFKGVLEEVSTLRIRSVAFPRGQCTSPQLNPCRRLWAKMGIKTVPHPLYSPDLSPCDFLVFRKLRDCQYETIEEMKEALMKVIDTSHKRTSMEPSRSYWNGISALQPEEITSKGTRVSCCVLSIKVWNSI